MGKEVKKQSLFEGNIIFLNQVIDWQAIKSEFHKVAESSVQKSTGVTDQQI